MADEFYLRQKDRHGTVKRLSVTDFLWMRYRNKVNDAGRLDFGIKSNSPLLDSLEEFDQFEVWRRNVAKGIDWHCDFYGLYRDLAVNTDDDGLKEVVVKCPGQQSILGFRQVAYPAGVANYSRFTSVAAETVMKRAVAYNCTALATVANGRLRAGDLGAGMDMTIVVATDQGRGNTISRSFSNANLLRVLREKLAPIAGGDFALTKTGPSEWTFEFYPGQLDEDKSTGNDKVEFSIEKGNLLRPSRKVTRINVATVAIVGGQDTGEDRVYEVVESDDYAADYDIELFVNASSETNAAALISAGEAKLDEHKPLEVFDFDVIQTGTTYYSRVGVSGRKTYQVGTVVSIVDDDIAYRRKIEAVEVNVAGDDVTISVETSEV